MLFGTRRARLALAAVGLVLALSVIACSGGDDDDGEGATGPAGNPPGSGVATTTPSTDTPAASTGGAETPTAPGFPSAEDEPPVTSASANGQTVDTGIGTYCWTRMCVDKIGVPTAGTLTVAGGDTVSVAIPEDVKPLREAGANVFEALNAMPLDDGSQIWPYPGAPGDPVTSEITAESVDVTIDLAPGTYVLAVGMYFDQGDVIYGVLIEVQ